MDIKTALTVTEQGKFSVLELYITKFDRKASIPNAFYVAENRQR